MPRVTWPLLNDRPAVRVVVMLGGQPTTIDLHADTGAGAASSAFEFLQRPGATSFGSTGVPAWMKTGFGP
jgi:hypothetical protein